MDKTTIIENGAPAPGRITRLPFRLREFSRVIWTSELAKDVWEPRISAITRAWDRLEVRAVETGLRPGALKSVAPEHVIALAAQGAKHGMVIVPLTREASVGGSYASAASPMEDGKPWTYRIAYCPPDLAIEWVKAWAAADSERVGELLGYPRCCRQFFRHFWVQEQYVDTTYPMSLGGTSGPVEANHMLRWLGIRLVPHLPHAHDCPETIAQARQYIDFARAEGFGQEMDWALEMLAWPMEWSALHGIAEIRLPVLKVNTLTDATAHKLVIRRAGTKYPAEGVRGTVFPYLPPLGVQLTKSRSFAKSLEGLEAEWKHNGFNTREVQERSHAMVVRAMQDGIPAGMVVDFGCGNGKLLEEVAKRIPGAVVGGMDAERDRALAAKRRHQNGDFAYGDLHDATKWPGGIYALSLLYPGRLLEEPDPIRREATRMAVLTRSERILFYSYEDGTGRKLLDLIREAGLEDGALGPLVQTPEGEAVMLTRVHRHTDGEPRHGDVPHGDVHGDHTDFATIRGVAPIGRPKELEVAQ